VLVLPVIVAWTVLPAFAAVPVDFVSVTNNAGRNVTIVVKTTPQAACEAREDVVINRATTHVGLGNATAGDDGSATWNVTFQYSGTRHVTVLCKSGTDSGSAATDVKVP
jgi:hypothetical protein